MNAGAPDRSDAVAGAVAEGTPLLTVRGLEVTFATAAGPLRAVAGLDLDLRRGEALGLVGESGCGKSVTAYTLLGLLDPPGQVTGGELRFAGQDLRALDEAGWRRLRGARLAMIFQEPASALNPVLTIGAQVAEQIRAHERVGAPAAWARAVAGLRAVGLPDAERQARQYPHQLSGGMRQRAMIAMAISCQPALLIADEPTTALDVTVQAQVLALLGELRRQTGMAMLYISHDLAAIAEVAERLTVMYAGRAVESGPTGDVLAHPRHPYTVGLLAARPAALRGTRAGGDQRRLFNIPGAVPSPLRLPPGCPFHPRCPRAQAPCRAGAPPPLRDLAPAHRAACHFPHE